MDVVSPWVPRTEEQKDQVRRQMDRLLETSHFRNSRRYPALLRFLVEETLEGRGEFLKERLLGVRVFNRPPDYDTANDPIVRVTVAEIRKRIAQYYHEEAHEAEMRIELILGRYEPEFYPRRMRGATLGELPEAGEEENESPFVGAPPQQAKRKNRRRLVVWGVAAGLLMLALVPAALWIVDQTSAKEQFWKSVLASRRTITFCMPTETAGSQTASAAGILSSLPAPQGTSAGPPGQSRSGPTVLDHETMGENVVFSDVLAALKISNWLASQNRESRLRLDGSTTLEDLQQGPAVLIGGLDNAWTLRAVSHLRYRFKGTGQEQYWIADRNHPGSRAWEVDLTLPYSAVKRDYALIARVHDELTGQVEVVVAGIGMSGTAAAGEFLVNADRLDDLRRKVGPRFSDHDFEAVLGTDVVNGIPGAPGIMAVSVE